VASAVSTEAYLSLGAILFGVGALGTLGGANPIGRLAGVELMVAAAVLTFVASAVGFRELDGQVAALLAGIVAVAQAVVGFALIVQMRRPE
jgi:NADH-quinone oxidoreductase subunit K